MSTVNAIHPYPTPATTPPCTESPITHPPIAVLASSRAVIEGRLTAATIVISLHTGKVTSVFHSVLPASDFPSGTPYVDHSPLILLPGLVDAHVHLNEPGRTAWEGFWTGTRAAAFGGVTTVVDMPLNAIPPTTTLRGLEEKVQAAQGQCWVDVGFYGGIVPGNASELKSLVSAGVRGFKGFLIDSGVEEFPAVSSTDIAIAMSELADEPTVLMFHAEMIPPISDSVGDDVQWSLPPLAPVGPLNEYNTFLASRPASFETYAISEILSLASCAPNLPLHIVHLSAIEAIPLLREARTSGIKVTSETCFHYLSLAAESIRNGDTRHKCCPPIRSQSNQDSLWDELLRKTDSVISTVVSDHSPCTPNLKLLPPSIVSNGTDEIENNGDFFAAWGGVSSVGLGLSILWTEGQKRGITVEDVAKWCCMNTAKQVGLERQKGDLGVGFDGDVAVFDDEATFEVGLEAMLFRNKCSPYQGKTLKGVVKETWLRGEKVFDRDAGFGKAIYPIGPATALMTTTMMGQTSSQPGPPSPQQSGAVADIMPGDTGPRKPKHRKDRKDRKSSEYGQVNADEEESARALLQMRDEAVNHVRRPSTEYDLAASSQLMNETYNTQPAASSEDDTSSKKRKRVGKGDPKRQKKRRQNTSDSRLQERTVSPIREDSPAAPAASDGTDGLDYLFNDLEEPSQSSSEPDNIHPLQSSHKLDDIHSDDGDVASLLQDYEQDEMSSFTFKKPHDQSHIEHHDTLNCTLPRSSPPSYDGALVKSHKNRKKKRKRHSGPSSDPHFEEDQTLPGVTGQHEFDIDFQAFDDFCAANGVGSANLFDDTPGQALPIDPVLMEEGELAHANNGVEANSEGDAATPRAQQAKRRRASLRSKRQAEDSAKMTVPLVSNDLLVDSLDLLNTDQQDQVLPGFEDMQRQSSQEYHPSRESSMASGRQSPSNETDVLEKVPASSRQKASTPKHKASQRKRKLHVSSPPAEDEAPKGGTYTIGEITKLEKVRENYCDEHKISEWQFNELIHNPVKGNSKAQTLWQEIYETLDYRTKHSLRRFCHRRFHNFGVRGAWTAEDDELLDHAVEEKGKSWVAVGQMMGRFEEDVRDRWRNYHVNAELRNTEKWLDSDVRNLAMAVDQCMHLMRDARLRALQEKYEGRDIPEAEWSQAQNVDDTKLINWQVVSDRMGGSKSRLQCSFKWGKLKDADRRRFMKEVKAARKAAIPQKPTKNPWRMTKAMKRAEQMRPGDKLELLEALSGCRALEELSIPWQSLGSSDFTARWKTSDKKAAWQIMKRNFAAPDWMDYQDIVNRLLTMQLAGGENLDEKYDPEVHGYGRAPHPMAAAEKVESKKKKMKEKLEKQKSKRKAKHASKPRKADRASKVKSAVFVPESDIEDDEVQEPSLETEDRNSGTQSNSDSRRSSNGSGTQAHNEDAEAARTADTSVDGSEDEELPRSRQVSDDLAELLRSVRDA